MLGFGPDEEGRLDVFEDDVAVVGYASGLGGAGKSDPKLVAKKADVLLLVPPSLVGLAEVGEVV